LTYVERGAELLRMDAVAYLWKEPGTACVHLPQTHQVVKLFREVLDAVAPRVEIVTETNVPERDNLSYFGDGRDEAQMVYQFPLAPLVLDAIARGDAGRLTAWAKGLALPAERSAFLNFLASHAGVARSGWKRDLNHRRLKLPELESALSDAATREALVVGRYSRLLEVRGRLPAFHGSSGQRVLETDPGIFALARGPRDGQVL